MWVSPFPEDAEDSSEYLFRVSLGVGLHIPDFQPDIWLTVADDAVNSLVRGEVRAAPLPYIKVDS